MYTLFVTGGIGSGKSLFVARLAHLGAHAVDLDAISHEVLEDPGAVDELSEAFGRGILDEFGAVMRPELARRAFASPEATEALDAITHPRIFARLQGRLAGGCACCAAGGHGINVVEVQLIDKMSDSLALADEVLGIVAPRELRRERALGRGMSPVDFERRDAAQITDEERARYCTATIVNDGSLEDLFARADAWWAAHAGATGAQDKEHA